MTSSTDTLGSRARFSREFGILTGAAVGVIAVRAREPFRAIDTLREIAFAPDTGREFRAWTMTNGWATYNRFAPNDNPTYDRQTAAMAALLAISGVDPASTAQTQTSGFPENGIYVMMWPHFVLPQLPPLIQCLAEYSQTFPEGRKRLVLVVPPEFTLPKELEECVVLMDFDSPSTAELRTVYEDVVGYSIARTDQRPEYSVAELDRLVNAGAGMTIFEFESAICRAFTTHRALLPNVPINDLVELVLKAKTEVVKRSEVLEIMPTGSMADIGGLATLKDWIRRRTHCFTEEAKATGVDTPKGCALIGPPGTGKSLAAKAIANELGVPLVRFDVSRVFGSLVGQSEGRVRAALKMIDSLSPCVALLDEVDKAFDMNSGGGDGGVGKRILGAILTHMQETTKAVFWVMTANRTQGLPPEMLRKGRLDEIFSVTVPNESERKDILSIHLSKRGKNPADIEGLDDVVQRSSGYVPAELEAAVKEACLVVYADWKDALVTDKKAVLPAVTGAIILDQLNVMKPLSVAFKEQFDAMQLWAEQNARAASATPTPARPRVAASALGSSAPRTRARRLASSLDG